MSWHELNLNIDYLTHSIVNQVADNCVYIAEQLENMDVSNIDSTDVELPVARMYTEVGDIKEKLQTVEDDLALINQGVTAGGSAVISPYYKNAKTINETFTIDDYRRWVNILNDLKKTIDTNRIWQILRLNDGIPVLSGDLILIRGDEIA